MKNKEKDSRADESILGMSLEAINSVADELSQQTDQNNPTKTGSYRDFLVTMKNGHEGLLNHAGYNKGSR
jgi:hypothetical protein